MRAAGSALRHHEAAAAAAPTPALPAAAAAVAAAGRGETAARGTEQCAGGGEGGVRRGRRSPHLPAPGAAPAAAAPSAPRGGVREAGQVCGWGSGFVPMPPGERQGRLRGAAAWPGGGGAHLGRAASGIPGASASPGALRLPFGGRLSPARPQPGGQPPAGSGGDVVGVRLCGTVAWLLSGYETAPVVYLAKSCLR